MLLADLMTSISGPKPSALDAHLGSASLLRSPTGLMTSAGLGAIDSEIH